MVKTKNSIIFMWIKLYINIQNKIKINKHKKNYIKKNVDAVKATQKQKKIYTINR